MWGDVGLLLIGAALGIVSTYFGSLFEKSKSLLDAKRVAYAKVLIALRAHYPEKPESADTEKAAHLALTEAELLVSDFELYDKFHHAHLSLQHKDWAGIYGTGAGAAIADIRNKMKKELGTEFRNIPWKKNWFFINLFSELRHKFFPPRERG